ncbi:hypothetical protein FPZ12_001600 [Amycolatopsis acidicola]|uniref:DUF6351 domain-containing protein n=1 Tax=Amycolatopsis acidicola TaxID=2596893 RepID=A0A5N0VIZ4_9PSEU|nr:DUF6351 family protein [Amycolatopsis acidicola]KAA9166289.1 hypothetical protein FPZ12_001600 [Amycolatopsis acidicola]
MRLRSGRSLILLAALAAPVLVPVSAAASPPARLAITSVSNPHPEFVSGGQVLVSVSGPARVSANGRDVTAEFRRQPDGSLLGLVSGLRDGANEITASSGGHRDATLRVTNHPVSGPVFSGAQQEPFYCETTAYGLPPAQQPSCAVGTQVSYRYRSTAGAFVPLADPSARPADLATATVNGRQVPYIVRVERGTIDRAVYEIAALYDGAPSPFAPDRSWNSRLVYTFGGGCNSGYHQGAATGGVLEDLFLGQGYAVASSSLNVLDTNCSPIISAEAAMMVKEHFVETYGPVLHTIGWGGSGGAIQQYDIAEAYPGIVDGIVPGISFPDPLATAGPVTDCRLLNQYFAKDASFTPAQKLAVSGYRDYTTCTSWELTFANRATATGSCNAAIPVAARWDPVTNPDGVKCNANEQLVNQFGRDPATGFVPSTLDSVGVQYGLAALEAGQISARQFVDLNAGIGGIDYTGAAVAQRTAGDRKALSAAYADDLLNSASRGLRETPIIDQRTDLDLAGFGNDIHTTEWSFAMRQRLAAANGTTGNQVIIESQPADAAAASRYELDAMDRWLTAIGVDHSGRSLEARVLANRPRDVSDGCYVGGQRIQAPLDSGQCGAAYPVAGNPRTVAGEGQAMDVLKCRLRPLDFRTYPVRFTVAQQATLRTAFPDGVCDYGKPGVGAQAARGTWRSY